MRKRLRASYISALCMELSLILDAGIPLSSGLEMLFQNESDVVAKPLLEQLFLATDDGAYLSQALADAGAFPAYMVQMIKIAERAGRMSETLQALSAYYDRQEQLQAHIKSAIIAPSILFVMMLAVVVILVSKVLPIFNDVFLQLGAQMSPVAQGLMAFGRGLTKYGALILALLFVLVILLLLFAYLPASRKKFAAFFKRLFGGRGVWGRVASARFASAMAMSTATGLDIDEALELTRALCGDIPSTVAKIDICQQKLTAGESLAQAIAASGILSPGFCSMLAVGLRTGSIDTVFEEIARRSDRSVREEIENIVGKIEPTLVIITSVLVGLVLLSVMLPLTSIMSALG